MMPEGPEVRTVVDQLQGGVGMVFQGVQFLSGRYVKNGPPDGYEAFVQTLDQSDKPVDLVKEWNAKGKFIYIVLNEGNNPSDDDFQRSIWITLGMSGRFVAASMNHFQSTEPRWMIKLAQHSEGFITASFPIVYHDPRNFGTLKFCLSARTLLDKLNSLGPDILNVETTTEDVFVDLVAAQKPDLNICKFLMNQKKISGVGNYILAEGLYRALIDPFCSLGELSESQQRSLFRELQGTALQSYRVNGLSRPGGSYRDTEGNLGRFEFELQCYGRTSCAKGKPVMKEIEGPHGRTIWYTNDQLFMPRALRNVPSKDLVDAVDMCNSLLQDSNESPRMSSSRDLSNVSTLVSSDIHAKRDKSRLVNLIVHPKRFSTCTYSVEGLVSTLTDEGWRNALSDSFQSKQFCNLVHFLQTERMQGIEVFPPEDEIFSALNLCPLASVKVVIVGQDPYHGKGQGHGLSFSVRSGVRPPPSLQNIFKEAQNDVGINSPRHGDLTCWAKQGVLLLNSVLTVRAGEANSHAKQGWEQLTDTIIGKLSNEKEGIVFLLWGRPAQLKASSVDETRHTIIRTSHPSPLGASKTNAPFLGSRCFSRTNAALQAIGRTPIDWSVN